MPAVEGPFRFSGFCVRSGSLAWSMLVPGASAAGSLAYGQSEGVGGMV